MGCCAPSTGCGSGAAGGFGGFGAAQQRAGGGPGLFGGPAAGQAFSRPPATPAQQGGPFGGGGGAAGGCCSCPPDCCATTPGGFGSGIGLDPGNPGATPIGNPGGDPNAGYPPELFGGQNNGVGAAQGAQAPQGAGGEQEFEKRLLELVNQARRQLGLPEVQMDENLSQLARRSAAAKTHTAAPEVLAPWGYSSPEDAMNAWQQSPGHWSIITDPSYTRMGAGWVGDGAAMTFG